MGASSASDLERIADMFAALGAAPRLRIVRLLLSAHPKGKTAGDLGTELSIGPSTLSHHLERLKRERLVTVRREGTFLWYGAGADGLQGILRFLYDECCTRSTAIAVEQIGPFHDRQLLS